MEQRQYIFELVKFCEDDFPSSDEFPSPPNILLDFAFQSSAPHPVAVLPNIALTMESLRTERIENGVTQDDVAESIGIKKAAVSRLENSVMEGREPAFSTLQKYAAALGYELHIACIPKGEAAVKAADAIYRSVNRLRSS